MTKIKIRAFIKVCKSLDQSSNLNHNNLKRSYGKAAYSYRAISGVLFYL